MKYKNINRPTAHTIYSIITILYFVGIFCTWAYLIAACLDSNNEDLIGLSVILGWVPALVWPMLALVSIMRLLFF